jgi:threonine aldolase
MVHAWAAHVDGARIWNAAIALETPPAELAPRLTPSCSACRKAQRAGRLVAVRPTD